MVGRRRAASANPPRSPADLFVARSIGLMLADDMERQIVVARCFMTRPSNPALRGASAGGRRPSSGVIGPRFVRQCVIPSVADHISSACGVVDETADSAIRTLAPVLRGVVVAEPRSHAARPQRTRRSGAVRVGERRTLFPLARYSPALVMVVMIHLESSTIKSSLASEAATFLTEYVGEAGGCCEQKSARNQRERPRLHINRCGTRKIGGNFLEDESESEKLMRQRSFERLDEPIVLFGEHCLL
jgi:hypothetical protein